MSNTTNFILIMIMIQIMIMSFSIQNAIREKDNTNSTQIIKTDVNKKPTVMDVLVGKATYNNYNTSNLEQCKALYPKGNYHYVDEGICVVLEWR